MTIPLNMLLAGRDDADHSGPSGGDLSSPYQTGQEQQQGGSSQTAGQSKMYIYASLNSFNTEKNDPFRYN